MSGTSTLDRLPAGRVADVRCEARSFIRDELADQCERRATVAIDEVPYCGQHGPALLRAIERVRHHQTRITQRNGLS